MEVWTFIVVMKHFENEGLKETDNSGRLIAWVGQGLLFLGVQLSHRNPCIGR